MPVIVLNKHLTLRVLYYNDSFKKPLKALGTAQVSRDLTFYYTFRIRSNCAHLAELAEINWPYVFFTLFTKESLSKDKTPYGAIFFIRAKTCWKCYTDKTIK